MPIPTLMWHLFYKLIFFSTILLICWSIYHLYDGGYVTVFVSEIQIILYSCV